MKKINKIVLVLFLCLFAALTACTNENKFDDCEHTYLEGVCTKCGYQCEHLVFDDEICSACGIEQYKVCKHEYTKGECDLCGYKCSHEIAHDGICDECEMNIQNNCHHTYVDGICTHCQKVCQHKTLNKGICLVCGTDYRLLCKHNFSSGVCTICTYACEHGDTYCGEECAICHMKAGHHYEGGKCTMCGKENKYTITEIPAEYLNTNCPKKGTVEKVSFESYDYTNKKAYDTTFYVYLPYGYNNNTDEYNVLYLLHGSGENSAYWLAQGSYAGGYTEKTKVVLDNMHYYQLCEPTIVVTPTENTNRTPNFYKELINNIMPQAETKYRTKAHLYGKDVTKVKSEDFIASRDYRAYAGLSLGSMIGWSIMAYDLPYFSYYGYYSGGTYGVSSYMPALKATLEDKTNPYDIKYAYHSCGDNDVMCQNHIDDYNEILDHCNGKLSDGFNCEFLLKPGFKHNYNAWIIDLYNSLGYAFFKYNDTK